MNEYNPNKDLILNKYKSLNTLGELLAKNKFTPDKPFRTDIISANKQQFNLAKEVQKNNPGKINEFILTQQILAATDKGINVVNPLILTNAIPGEGILTTKIGYPQIGYEKLSSRIDSGSVDKTKRILASTNDFILGQEEGIKYSSIRTIGDLITKGGAAVVGLFSSQKKKINVNLKATEATFEQRLDQNDLTPNNTNSELDVYNAIYSRKYIAGISQKKLSEGFSPIGQESIKARLLQEDSDIVLKLEDGFKNNAIQDNTFNNLGQDGEQYDADTEVQIFSKEIPEKILFPFYMESLNSLQENELDEKFITFQATFAGLKEKFTPQWSETNYFGRNTNTKLYSNTTHTLDFDFVIWSKNRFDLALIKQRVNWLIKHCYPKYLTVGDQEKVKILSEGPVISITIGDIFKNVTGIITNLDINWDLEGNNRWELSDSVTMLQIVKITLSFEAIFNKFMENVGIQNGNKIIASGDFYPAININTLRKRKFKLENITQNNGFDIPLH
jgi:hypothetical protein